MNLSMSVDVEPTLTPYNWLNEAVVYNKRNEIVPTAWLRLNADALALLFTSRDIDREGIVTRFCTIYEDIKRLNLPIEVIYIPMDDTEEDMLACYNEQANWFTLRFDDPLVPKLKYMHGVTCIPHLLVVKIDGTVISSHGILDLEEYGKNAVLTWLSTSANTKCNRRLSKETNMYGENWDFATRKATSITEGHHINVGDEEKKLYLMYDES